VGAIWEVVVVAVKVSVAFIVNIAIASDLESIAEDDKIVLVLVDLANVLVCYLLGYTILEVEYERVAGLCFGASSFPADVSVATEYVPRLGDLDNGQSWASTVDLGVEIS